MADLETSHATIDHTGVTGVGVGDATAHLADATDAHDASAISFVPAGTIAATTVQAAIEEVATEAAGGGIPSGTSNPGSPADGDLFFRSDLDLIIRYRSSGTLWLCTCLHDIPMLTWNQSHTPMSSTTGGATRSTIPPYVGGSDLWIEDHVISFYVIGGSALAGGHKWVGTFCKADSAVAETTVATQNIDSGASDAYRRQIVTVNALLGTTFPLLQTNWTKTGSPGNLIVQEMFSCRIVVP